MAALRETAEAVDNALDTLQAAVEVYVEEMLVADRAFKESHQRGIGVPDFNPRFQDAAGKLKRVVGDRISLARLLTGLVLGNSDEAISLAQIHAAD